MYNEYRGISNKVSSYNQPTAYGLVDHYQYMTYGESMQCNYKKPVSNAWTSSKRFRCPTLAEPPLPVEKTKSLPVKENFVKPSASPVPKRTPEEIPLSPVFHPLFNVREMVKQSILLEAHLQLRNQQCRDCIMKHFFTLEALAEEGIGLDVLHEYHGDLVNVPHRIRQLQQQWLQNDPDDWYSIAQELRSFRKKFMHRCFNLAEIESLQRNNFDLIGEGCSGTACTLKK